MNPWRKVPMILIGLASLGFIGWQAYVSYGVERSMKTIGMVMLLCTVLSLLGMLTLAWRRKAAEWDRRHQEKKPARGARLTRSNCPIANMCGEVSEEGFGDEHDPESVMVCSLPQGHEGGHKFISEAMFLAVYNPKV